MDRNDESQNRREKFRELRSWVYLVVFILGVIGAIVLGVIQVNSYYEARIAYAHAQLNAQLDGNREILVEIRGQQAVASAERATASAERVTASAERATASAERAKIQKTLDVLVGKGIAQEGAIANLKQKDEEHSRRIAENASGISDNDKEISDLPAGIVSAISDSKIAQAQVDARQDRDIAGTSATVGEIKGRIPAGEQDSN